ncbi:non-ribosomal peptide synthetase [Shimazuella kribbensis]|uniref:non-ribosomal peptide synthetase n=1 Tax=Shimazuella kribbensis TaxID=139808 RepID=UPI0003FF9E6C|nr:non-ribosomal peptide synthetase [Shimazuella kribbensis]
MTRKIYPLNEAQKGIWHLEVFFPHTSVSNIAGRTKLDYFNMYQLQEAVRIYMRHHDILRTRLTTQTGKEPVQYIANDELYELSIHDLSNYSNEEVEDWFQNQTQIPFTLFDSALIEFAAVIQKERFYLYVKCHHILLDGISLDLVVHKVKNIYQNLLKRTQIDIDENKTIDTYLERDKRYQQTIRYQKDEQFWLEELASIPDDIINQADILYTKSLKASRKEFVFTPDMKQKIEKFCSIYGISPYTLFMSALFYYFARMNNTNETILGTYFGNRQKSERGDLGMFLNTVPFYIQFDETSTVLDLIRNVNRKQMKLLRHQKFPYHHALDKKEKTSPGIKQIFTMGVEYQEVVSDQSDIYFSGYDFHTINFHLKKMISKDQLTLIMDYRNELFSPSDIEVIMDRLLVLLTAMITSPEQPLTQLSICSTKEEAFLIHELNDTQIDLPSVATIHGLFETIAQASPDHPAVITPQVELTYEMLNKRANQLAHYLRNQRVKPDDRVGLCMDSSIERIIAILAVLKSGCAYVPISTDYPKQRIQYMLEDSRAIFVLSQSSIIQKFKDDTNQDTPWLDVDQLDITNECTNNPLSINKNTDLAYIIYTSGTTGKPKGVMEEHIGLINATMHYQNFFQINQNDKVGQFLQFAFDGATKDLCLSLFSGTTLYLIPEEVKHDFRALEQFVHHHQLTFLGLTPSYAKHVNPHAVPHVRYLICGGSASSGELVSKWKDRYVVSYGPSESTVVTSMYHPNSNIQYRNVPIGKPIANKKVYIFNQHQQLQPIGVAGELCIGGIGLARGYLGRLALTEEKFISNPYLPHERIYRTGDLVRVLPDGNMEYLGRMDQQVKIRGYRIEPAEIEATFRLHPAINDVVIQTWTDKSSENYLCAYILYKKVISQSQLQSFLADRLPSYMIPDTMMGIKEIPLTTNGKIDYPSLPKPHTDRGRSEYSPPQSAMEKELVSLWEKVLKIDRIGIHDSFFHVGGNSLHAIQLLTQLQQKFSTPLSNRMIFEYATIQRLAAYLDSLQTGDEQKLQPIAYQEYYPVSPAQKRMFVLQQMQPEAIHYNIPGGMEIKGSLDVERLEQAFQQLVQRHESLRTSFHEVNGELVQKINGVGQVNIKHVNGTKKDINEIMSSFLQPFSLTESPLLRVQLVYIEENHHILLVDMHHMISDGSSIDIMLHELSAFYKDEQLAPLSIHYKDYTAWQREWLDSANCDKQEKYWLKEYSDIPVLDLSKDHLATPLAPYEGNRFTFSLGKTLQDGLNQLTIELNSTKYMLLLAAFNLLLYKYSNQSAIVIGTPVAGRSHPDLHSMLGMFVNTVAIRNELTDEDTLLGFIQRVKNKSMSAFDHADYPFEMLVEKLKLDRDFSQNPLFQVLFTMQNFGEHLLQMDGLQIDLLSVRPPVSKFDLSLTANESENDIVCHFDYQTSLFEATTMERFAKHFRQIIHQIIQSPNQTVGSLDILTQVEKTQLLHGWNQPEAAYPAVSLSQLFEEQVKETPNNIAVALGSEEMTYQELDGKSNQLAREILSFPLEKNPVIGIIMDRSLDMIVSILAVLKAGGAYLPIDPTYPTDRIEYMLNDSQANLLIVPKRSFVPSYYQKDRIILEEIVQTHNPAHLPNMSKPDDLAYIIYTSGSTGKPKGVMVEHRNVVSLLFPEKSLYDFSSSDIWTFFHSYCFDFSVWEMYGALLFGGKLIIVPQEVARDSMAFLSLLSKEKVTIVNQTPSSFYALTDAALPADNMELAIRYVIFGGEALNPSKLGGWTKKYPEIQFVNMYGITETTVHVTYKKLTSFDIASNRSVIGRPIPTLQLFVLDAHLQPVPIGVIGELYVSGSGVARGYLHRPELTDSRFIQNPYDPLKRMYKTGDLVRRLQDGDLEYMGRSDQQVKIRGHRVEIGEIESVLLQHDQIHHVVVQNYQNNEGESYLCSYLVGDNINTTEIKTYLNTRLPKYMVPAFSILLDSIPLTKNGKVDHKALPKPEDTLIHPNDQLSATTEMEKKLVLLWENIFSMKGIGVNQNFFHLGGNSLNAIRLVNQIQQHFSITLPVRTIFDHSTIAELATHLEKEVISDHLSIPIAPTAIYQPLSYSQRRMYFLQALDPQSTHYHIPGGIWLEGKIDANRLEKAFLQIMERHEILRTTFLLIQGEPMQYIHTQMNWKLERDQAFEAQIPDKITSFSKAFSLETGPLFRAKLIQVHPQKHLLLFDIHHIVSDGVSIELLLQELIDHYRGKNLAQPTIQYKDYAVWQNQQFDQKKLETQEAYWLENLSDKLPTLDLQTDFSRTKKEDLAGASISFELDTKLVENIQNWMKKSGFTLYMCGLAAFNILLSTYTRQSDILVGTPVSGRTHPDLQNIMGLFVNTIVLRNRPESQKTIGSFLQEVKEQSLRAFENQDYPLEALIDKLQVERETGRNPLFDTMFGVQNFNKHESLVIDGIKTSALPEKTSYSKFDLSLFLSEQQSKITGTMQYRTSLFQRETIERLIQHFMVILQKLIDKPNQCIGELDLLSDREKKQILKKWNQTKADYPKHPIHLLFENQVKKTPYQIAAVYDQQSITYKALNARANQLAWTLRQRGIGPNDRVAFLTNRSISVLVGILAVLKAGGAYVPIDPKHPIDRIQYMLQDCGAKLVIGESLDEELSFIINDPIWIDLQDEQNYHPDTSNISNCTHITDLAYIIYTSGTTGNPKGVMVEHIGIPNLIWHHQRMFPYTSQDRIAQFASTSFDASVLEIFHALLSGMTLVLIPETVLLDIDKFQQYVHQHHVTYILVPPVYAQYLEKEKLPLIQKIFVGGEQSPKELAEKWAGKFVNAYGPTETTVASTNWVHSDSKSVSRLPIGKPIANTQLYILNKSLHPLPIGAIGELYIGGDGLARGYCNQHDLTEEKFLSNPFIPGERIYKTGDLARWLPDGNIEYMGRVDQQVKIRGFRVELGEIESVYKQFPTIKQAKVINQIDERGDTYLIAFVVASATLDLHALKEFIQSKLPNYMVPAFQLQIEKISVNRNGKADKIALHEIQKAQDISKEDIQLPTNKTEQELCTIWSEILAISSIGIDQDFFSIGGHSLKAIQLMSKIRENWSVEFPLRSIFQNPTIKQQAKIIHSDSANSKPVTLLNKEQRNHIFCFPPIFGWGMLYKGLARLFDTHSFYGFDFILSDDRMGKYVQHILSIQPNGPIQLLGYSAGGVLAYEVAKKLEEKGHSVSDIIMLDSRPSTSLHDDVKGDPNQVEQWIKKFASKEPYALFFSHFTQKELIHMVSGYWSYLDQIQTTGETKATIHQILANNTNDTNNWWTPHTHMYRVNQGFGDHAGMLVGENLQKNAQILSTVLTAMIKEKTEKDEKILIPH